MISEPEARPRRLVTPLRRATVIRWALLLLVSAPAVNAWILFSEQSRGAFPPDGDAVAIPIAGSAFLALIAVPAAWAFTRFCTRRYPGRLSYAAWNAARPFWSAAWTAAFGCAALCLFAAGVEAAVRDHLPLFLHVLADVWLLLVLRSSVVSQPLERG